MQLRSSQTYIYTARKLAVHPYIILNNILYGFCKVFHMFTKLESFNDEVSLTYWGSVLDLACTFLLSSFLSPVPTSLRIQLS